MFWNWNTQSPGEVIGGKGILRVQDVFQLSLGHNFAAARSGARTKIDNVVGRPDCFFVVLDHDHGVPEVSQPSQDRKSTRLNSSHLGISYAVFCLKKKTERLIMVRLLSMNGAPLTATT